MNKLISTFDNYALSVSMTTRQPRPGEVNGREYFFSDVNTFEQKIQEGGLIEYASYCGNYYGTPKDYVTSQLDLGKDVILEIEIQGALKIKETFQDALLLFVMPPSVDELYKRLVGRGTETEEVILKRLERAYEESEGIEEYDYIVINDNLDDCVQEMHQMIKMARNVPVRNIEFIENVRNELKGISKGE